MRKVLTTAEGRPRSERGIALVTVLLFMLVMLTAGLVMTDRVAYTAWEVNQRIQEQQAFLLAEAGMNQALWWLNTQYRQPTTTLLNTTMAPVRFNGQPLSFVPSNHPDSYTACSDGTLRNGVVASFNDNLGGTQTLGRGTYVVNFLRLLTAREDCSAGVVADRPEMWEIRVTGTYQGVERTVTAMVRRRTFSLWDTGIFADEQIIMDSNARTGSFDSRTGEWDALSQTWSNAEDGHGSIGTNGTARGVIDVRSNARVYGDATPGPGAVVEGVDSAVRLSKVRPDDPSVTGAIKPASAIKELPDPPAPPSCLVNCNHTFTSGTTNTLLPGNYGVVTVDANATLELVLGGAYSFTTLRTLSNSAITLSTVSGITSGASSVSQVTKVTVTNRFILDSNVKVNKGGRPDRLEVIMTADTSNVREQPNSDNSSINLLSNNIFVGTIYAPNAKVRIDSNAQVHGAVIADRLWMGGNAEFYYDRSLQNQNPANNNRDMIVPYFAANL